MRRFLCSPHLCVYYSGVNVDLGSDRGLNKEASRREPGVGEDGDKGEFGCRGGGDSNASRA